MVASTKQLRQATLSGENQQDKGCHDTGTGVESTEAYVKGKIVLGHFELQAEFTFSVPHEEGTLVQA